MAESYRPTIENTQVLTIKVSMRQWKESIAMCTCCQGHYVSQLDNTPG